MCLPHTHAALRRQRCFAKVMSGMLDWTPSHTSDLFWRQNIDKFEEKDFQVI
jgi:hypothetical protein